MKRKVAVIAMVLGIAFAPGAVADITVSSTSPTAGTSLTVGPNVVSITASVPLVDQGSLIVVNDPNGTAVDDGSIAQRITLPMPDYGPFPKYLIMSLIH